MKVTTNKGRTCHIVTFLTTKYPNPSNNKQKQTTLLSLCVRNTSITLRLTQNNPYQWICLQYLTHYVWHSSKGYFNNTALTIYPCHCCCPFGENANLVECLGHKLLVVMPENLCYNSVIHGFPPSEDDINTFRHSEELYGLQARIVISQLQLHSTNAWPLPAFWQVRALCPSRSVPLSQYALSVKLLHD